LRANLYTLSGVALYAAILMLPERIADPMRLQIGEWNGLLDAAARGDLRRSEPMDARSFVDSYMAKG
jgi:hypothetical protein